LWKRGRIGLQDYRITERGGGMNAFESFGTYFKELRQRGGLTLRSFCMKYGLDPGNMSKMERGLMPPPKSREVLEKYAEYLEIKKGEDDYYKFFDLVAICHGNVPSYVMDDPALVSKLPLVFRTLRGQEVPSDQLKDLAELIRRS
jgi:transcriptional regulator with XRE-family HTH domain